MSAEFWAMIGVGIAVLGLVWRLDTRFNGLEARLDGRLSRLAKQGWIVCRRTWLGIKEQLAAVEATLALLVKGLHIDIQGRETQ